MPFFWAHELGELDRTVMWTEGVVFAVDMGLVRIWAVSLDIMG
jgi:hypothetical protein